MAQSVSAIGPLAWPKITTKQVARDLQTSVSTARRVRGGAIPTTDERRERLADRLQHLLEKRLGELAQLEAAIGALRKARR